MAKLPYMFWYPADHKAQTSHLTLEEQGAYRTLIDELWLADGQISYDVDRLRRRLGTTKAKFEKIWDVIGEFFCLEGGKIRHRRVDAELKLSKERVEARSKAGRIGAQARHKKARENRASSLASAQQTLSNSESEPESEGSGRTNKGSTMNLGLGGIEAIERLRQVAKSANALQEIEHLKQSSVRYVDGELLVSGKYSLDRFTESLAKELRSAGIRVRQCAAADKSKPNLKTIKGGRS